MTVVIGTLGDGGETLRRLREELGVAEGSLDLVFIDHDKDAYLPDLQRIEAEGWLHPGSVVVADNVKFPSAPAYRSYMRDHAGTLWRTIQHRAHVEVFSPEFVVRRRLGAASLQVRPLRQRSVKRRLPGACAEGPRPKSLTTR